MLARSRDLLLGGRFSIRTPLLCPSFSSKGFPDVSAILDFMSEFITGGVLVSAYDIHHGTISAKKIVFPELVFLDSGGYETRVEHDLSEAYGRVHKPRKWTRELYFKTLKKWPRHVPTVIVSFDSPKKFFKVKEQVHRTQQLEKVAGGFPVELLIKPESKNAEFVSIETVLQRVGDLRAFAAVGLTEKELDSSMLGRMEKIARLRLAMDSAKVDIPIHIFGSLDTLSTPLYFISGAEIFDGLTWLRFGYREGRTIYSQNYGTTQDPHGLRLPAKQGIFEMWKNNYYYLEQLRDEMINYVRTSDFSLFKHVGTLLNDAHTQLQARLSGQR
jgi:hypothetical protein